MGDVDGDLERLFQFLAENDPHIAGDAAIAIRSAVEMLASHPLAGPRGEGELRELGLEVRIVNADGEAGN